MMLVTIILEPFGLWIADFVAGGGPTDTPLFDNIRAIAYLTDTDRLSGGNVFDGGLIGEMGLKFIETQSIDGLIMTVIVITTIR